MGTRGRPGFARTRQLHCSAQIMLNAEQPNLCAHSLSKVLPQLQWSLQQPVCMLVKSHAFPFKPTRKRDILISTCYLPRVCTQTLGVDLGKFAKLWVNEAENLSHTEFFWSSWNEICEERNALWGSFAEEGGFMPSCIPCLYSMSYKMNMINDSFYFTWGIWG